MWPCCMQTTVWRSRALVRSFTARPSNENGSSAIPNVPSEPDVASVLTQWLVKAVPQQRPRRIHRPRPMMVAAVMMIAQVRPSAHHCTCTRAPAPAGLCLQHAGAAAPAHVNAISLQSALPPQFSTRHPALRCVHTAREYPFIMLHTRRPSAHEYDGWMLFHSDRTALPILRMDNYSISVMDRYQTTTVDHSPFHFDHYPGLAWRNIHTQHPDSTAPAQLPNNRPACPGMSCQYARM